MRKKSNSSKVLDDDDQVTRKLSEMEKAPDVSLCECTRCVDEGEGGTRQAALANRMTLVARNCFVVLFLVFGWKQSGCFLNSFRCESSLSSSREHGSRMRGDCSFWTYLFYTRDSDPLVDGAMDVGESDVRESL